MGNWEMAPLTYFLGNALFPKTRVLPVCTDYVYKCCQKKTGNAGSLTVQDAQRKCPEDFLEGKAKSMGKIRT